MKELSKLELTLGCARIVASHEVTMALRSVAAFVPQVHLCVVLQEHSVSAESDFRQDCVSAVVRHEMA